MYSNFSTVSFLLEQGANVHSRNTQLDMPIHTAVKRGEVGITRLLIQHGSPLMYEGNIKRTPLHLAVMYGHLDLVHLLTERGVQIHTSNALTSSPLILAMSLGYYTIVYVLLQQMTSSDIYDTTLSQTPLQHTLEHDMRDSMVLLLEAGAQEPRPQDVPRGSCRNLLKRLRMLREHDGTIRIRPERMSPKHRLQCARIALGRSLYKAGLDLLRLHISDHMHRLQALMYALIPHAHDIQHLRRIDTVRQRLSIQSSLFACAVLQAVRKKFITASHLSHLLYFYGSALVHYQDPLEGEHLLHTTVDSRIGELFLAAMKHTCIHDDFTDVRSSPLTSYRNIDDESPQDRLYKAYRQHHIDIITYQFIISTQDKIQRQFHRDLTDIDVYTVL